MGIEPTRPAWKAGVLPLNYTRIGQLVHSIKDCVSCQMISGAFLQLFFMKPLSCAQAGAFLCRFRLIGKPCAAVLQKKEKVADFSLSNNGNIRTSML